MRSQEDQEYIDDMRELFSTRGWKRVVADAKEAVEVRKERFLRCQSVDEMRYMQGEVIQLQIISDMQKMIEEVERLTSEAEEVLEDN